MKSLGRHILAEYYECNKEKLNDVEFCRNQLREAAIVSGATIVEECFHLFNPWGVSGVVVIAESHLTIHTWPEYGYAAVDLFTCGDEVDPWKGFSYLREKFESGNVSMTELRRGLLPPQMGNVKHKPDGF